MVVRGKVTARGVEFLNEWVGENLPPLPVTGDVLIRALAQKLRDDAAAGRNGHQRSAKSVDDLERAALARILERKTDNTRDRIAGLLRCTCWLKSVCLVDRSSSQMSTSTGMGRSTCVGGLPRKPTTVIDASDSALVAVLEPASSGGVVSALWAWAVTGISAATATVTSSSVWLLLAFPPAFCCMQCFKFAG